MRSKPVLPVMVLAAIILTLLVVSSIPFAFARYYAQGDGSKTLAIAEWAPEIESADLYFKAGKFVLKGPGAYIDFILRVTADNTAGQTSAKFNMSQAWVSATDTGVPLDANNQWVIWLDGDTATWGVTSCDFTGAGKDVAFGTAETGDLLYYIANTGNPGSVERTTLSAGDFKINWIATQID